MKDITADKVALRDPSFKPLDRVLWHGRSFRVCGHTVGVDERDRNENATDKLPVSYRYLIVAEGENLPFPVQRGKWVREDDLSAADDQSPSLSNGDEETDA